MKSIAVLVAALALAQSPSTDGVIARLDAYLTAYEPQLSELIADESMIQEARRLDRVLSDGIGGSYSERENRRLLSEVAFISLPNDGGWLGFRHVRMLNRREVEENFASLAAALQTQSLDRARKLVEASAQYNLGLPRTTNLPNLPLEFLHRRNRHRLVSRGDGLERVRGVDTVRIVFLERLSPTVIKNPNGSDMPSVVRAWIDPSNGRLLRAEVNTLATFNAREFEHSVRVDFEPNKALGLLVPSEMREVFPVGNGKMSNGTSVANYSNFRRFQTSGRIVPQ
jgi:hypothetical protein